MGSDAETIDRAAEATAAFEAIKGFLSSHAALPAATSIDLDTQLLADGTLDSLAILQLTLFLADELQIEVSDQDFVPDNFETVGSLVQFVMRKRGIPA